MVCLLAHGGGAPYRPATITRPVHRNQGHDFLGPVVCRSWSSGSKRSLNGSGQPVDQYHCNQRCADLEGDQRTIRSGPIRFLLELPTDRMDNGKRHMTSPIQKYHDMVREWCRRYPTTYALAYQQCDRYRKDVVPELYIAKI